MLYNLIKSISRDEENRFIIYLNSFNSETYYHLIQLFNNYKIAENESYVNLKIIKKNEKFLSLGTVNGYKTLLLKETMLFLKEEEKESKYFILLEKLQEIKILSNRGLYNDALKLINKSISIILNEDYNYSIYLELLKSKRDLFRKFPINEVSSSTFSKINIDIHNVLAEIEIQNASMRSFETILLRNKKEGNSINEYLDKVAKKIHETAANFYNELENKVEESKVEEIVFKRNHFHILVYIYLYKAFAFLCEGNREKNMKMYEKIIELYNLKIELKDSSIERIKDNHEYKIQYISIMNNYLPSYCILGKYEEFDNKIRALAPENKDISKLTYIDIFHYQTFYYLKIFRYLSEITKKIDTINDVSKYAKRVITNNYIDNIEKIEIEIEKLIQFITIPRIVTFYYNLAALYFIISCYKEESSEKLKNLTEAKYLTKVKELINKINQLPKQEFRKDALHQSLLISLLINNEEKNEKEKKKNIAKINKKLSENNKFSLLSNILIDIVSNDSIENMKEKLDEFKKNSETQEEFIRWLEIKISQSQKM